MEKFKEKINKNIEQVESLVKSENFSSLYQIMQESFYLNSKIEKEYRKILKTIKLKNYKQIKQKLRNTNLLPEFYLSAIILLQKRKKFNEAWDYVQKLDKFYDDIAENTPYSIIVKIICNFIENGYYKIPSFWKKSDIIFSVLIRCTEKIKNFSKAYPFLLYITNCLGKEKILLQSYLANLIYEINKQEGKRLARSIRKQIRNIKWESLTDIWALCKTSYFL